MTRICKLEGCSLPVSGPRAEFCKPAHRAAYWRTRHVVAVVQEPGPRSGANARSGRQVSYAKAVREVEAFLAKRYDQRYAREIAEDVVSRALPERQRERNA